MSYEQRIYEDFTDYERLNDLYSDGDQLWAEMEEDYNFDYALTSITSNSQTRLKLQVFISELVMGVIFAEYGQDRIGYKDEGGIHQGKVAFERRLAQTLVDKVSKWYLQGKIDDELLTKVNLDNFIITNSAITNTGELGVSGSIVEQESASTPTGITHDDSDTTSMEIVAHTSDVTIETTSMYQDKYTNFMGKTQGVKQNKVDRDVQSERSGNYILAMELLKAVPYSYINEVLRDVSQHFIQVY